MREKILMRAATLALGLLMLPQFAAADKVGDVEIRLQPLPNKDPHSGQPLGTRHGYVEYRVQLKNSATEDRVVHLAYPASRPGLQPFGVAVSRTVRVAGGQEVAVSLFQPPVPVFASALEVHVDGEQDGKIIPVESLHSYYYGPNSPNSVAVLLSRSVPQDFRDLGLTQPRAKSVAPTTHTPGAATPAFPRRAGGLGGLAAGLAVAAAAPPTDPFALLRSEVPVSQWSPNWLGYSCYDAMVMTGKEAEEMPPQVQSAVRRFVECGGTLLIHGVKLPAVFSQGGIRGAKGVYTVGFGCAAASLDDMPGRSETKTEDDKTSWAVTWQKLKSLSPHVYAPAEKPVKLYDLLVAETTVPVRGLFALVLLFGVAIGPANLWLLSRYKRRIWLWWTVPAISLVTCLAVFGYSLASEGWIGHGKTASLTLLDERDHRAATIGYLSYYCPLTPSMGARFSVDTDVALLGPKIEPWQRYPGGPGGAGLRFVDWTTDQHLTSGWVNARVPAYFQIRKNEDRRERLTVEKQADGSLKVVNALGAAIQRLYLADSSGRVFEGQDIPAGQQRTLAAAAVKLNPFGDPALARNIFSGPDLLTALHDWAENKTPAALLAPGRYLAYLDKSPFIESPLAGVKSEDTLAIVYGISQEQDHGR